MKKYVVTAFALCATTLFADESFGGIGLVVQDGNIGLGMIASIPKPMFPSCTTRRKHRLRY